MRSPGTSPSSPIPSEPYSSHTPWKTLLRILRDLLVIAVGMVVAFLALLCVLAFLFWRSQLPTSNPSHYPALAESLAARAPESFGFLPTFIDPAAEAVGFLHTPGSLRTNDEVSLRLRLPSEKIQQLLPPLSSLHCLELSSGSQNFPGYVSYGSPIATGAIPPGFRVFVHRQVTGGGSANHNFIALTAVSVERREVVYYAGWFAPPR